MRRRSILRARRCARRLWTSTSSSKLLKNLLCDPPWGTIRPGCVLRALSTTIGLLLIAGLTGGGRAEAAQQGYNLWSHLTPHAASKKKGKTQDRLAELSLEELGNLEVTTASKEPEKVSRTPAAIYVITQEDIRRSGATSIPDALRLVPGVEVARIDSDKWSIGVRGFGSRLSRSVLVLIDGRSVYTPLFAGVYWEVQDTLLEDIDRIEVIRGPGGTIWGANAVNGIINIITRDAKHTQGTLLSTGGGNVDQGFVGFRYGAGNGKNFNYRVYGKAFTRGPEDHSDRTNFDDWRMGQTGFRADWDSQTRDTFTLQGDAYKGDTGERFAIGTSSPPFVANVEQNAELAGGNLLGRWRRVFSEGSDIQLKAYYDRTNRQEADFAESRDTFDIDFLHHIRPRRQDVLWGLGARLSSGNATAVIPTVVFTPEHRTEKLYSAFVQDEIELLKNRLWLTVGSKFEHNNYTGLEAQPSARLLWTPSPRQTLWAAVTRAVRTPSRVEEDLQLSGLLVANPLTFYRIIGNTNFSPEELVGYEAGYRSLVRPSFYLDVATFYNSYNHLLSAESAGAPFSESSPPPPHVVVPFLLGNGLLGNTYGIEIAPVWKPLPWWRVQGSYSYLKMELRRRAGSIDSTTVASTEGASPNHQVVIQSFLNLPRKLEFDQTVRYVSALPAQQVGSYWTADARFSWRATPKLEFSVVGQNLIQPRHPEFGGDPGPLVQVKRSAYGKITFRWREK
jgi:iron complex outermembrane receptor protein